ncbi:dephospho-CoA kinase [Ectobacillus ponti]|uniref:Dephospho-CoA kinase n=1 Tax=Ectobacillus ponti TaxID=2961894 RepID=A0AA42BPC7_9BACI|nr:dephospho-CoA kinase [Ectobacillus ponti]MCP8967419.1 dephospho-CoA kinase [Ectobacillus ponti]
MALVVGLTGGIASGKSTVSAMLREQGIPVVDADVIAREVVEPGKPAYRGIAAAFGEDILLPGGGIDRAKLGGIIFHDAGKRQELNSIVHPAVRAEMLAQKEAYIREGRGIVVLDIPLLFESKLEYLADRILLVYVDEETQLQRLMQRNRLSEEEAKARIASQMPLAQKIVMADHVINNNGPLMDTKAQLLRILEDWQQEKE